MAVGDVYLAKFPFGGSAGMKIRPVLALTDFVGPVPEVIVAYISSVSPKPMLPSDLVIDPAQPAFSSTHLKVVSYLRLHKLASIHQTSVVRRLGRLSPIHMAMVEGKLRTLFGL